MSLRTALLKPLRLWQARRAARAAHIAHTATPPIAPATLPWLMATALATVAPHFEFFPYWLSGLAALLLFWRAALWRRGGRAPHSLWLLLLALAGSAGIIAEYRTLFGREAGVALLALLMMLKLLELRAARDGTVVVMLAYFLLLTHYFVADSMAVGAWMLIALGITTAAMIRLQSPDSDTPQNTLRLSARLIAQALPIMLILFLLFPRISGPLWGLPQDSRRAVTGLSEEMSPGSISELSQSTALAFRVAFADTVPPKESLYWRGPVMTEYDGRTWRTARGLGSSSPQIRALEAPIKYTLTLEPHHQRWLLALDAPVQLPSGTRLNSAMSVLTRAPLRERTRYEFSSATSYRAGENETAAELQRALALPAQSNPQARALARRWRAEIDRTQVSDAAKSETIAGQALQMFGRQGFVYTLRPPLLGAQPVDDFLFQSRRGFCEHYAAAFVFLMRAADIPARVVGGYQGGELNPLDGVLTVRQSDAHAWAEIWIAGRGWVRIDPTAAVAPSRVEQGLEAALPAGETLPVFLRGDLDWLRALRYRWDAVNNAWNIWVIGYNSDRQRDILTRLGMNADWTTLVTLLAGAGSLIALALLFWIQRPAQSRDATLRLWLLACRRIGAHGIVRHPDEGPMDYANRVAASDPQYADLAKSVASLYSRIRYANDRRPETQKALRAAVAALPRAPLSARLLSRKPAA